MEGIEDIPGTALHEGMDWTWESFPDFLDTLACAQARAGDFNGAIATSRRALELIRSRSFPAEVVRVYEERLASFRAGQAVVDGPEGVGG